MSKFALQLNPMIEANKFKNLLEVLDYFKDESTCKDYLEQQRWGGNPCCPHCKHDKVYRTKVGFKCASPTCYKKFSVLVGTPMENTKIKLRYWFAAIYLLSAHKKGISSHQLGRDLNISQKTAWFLNHRVRQMFVDHYETKLSGVIQADESFCGGKNKNRHKDKKVKNSQGRSYKDKTPIIGILCEGKIRTFVRPNTACETIQPILEANIEEGATLMTDEWTGYSQAHEKFNHLKVYHGAKQYVDGMIHCNGVENFWSHLKRGIIGIYHQLPRKHLQRYAYEYQYRFNTRKFKSEERFHILLSRTNGRRLKYKDLIAGKSSF